ncbi:hypothetical protein LZ30DRAFT_22426 [Colletotrichum cereale]|nr:hypothetical protein LZ30DRAFT_22426 [Colletotrichum cereale]
MIYFASQYLAELAHCVSNSGLEPTPQKFPGSWRKRGDRGGNRLAGKMAKSPAPIAMAVGAVQRSIKLAQILPGWPTHG